MRSPLCDLKIKLLTFVLIWMVIQPVTASQAGLKMIDYRSKINRHFSKEKRSKTDFIIVHTSEASLESTLKTVSQGKMLGKRRLSSGGHAHYVIAREGTVYRILDKKYRAHHAGLSRWNGIENLNECSIGIELVAYHTGSITDAQYQSLKELLQIVQRVYSVPDRNVLTHCQVAYGRPNKWFQQNHRGRKRCAMNFERSRVGLKDRWTYDPDVRAGTLAEDPVLASVLYSVQPRIAFDVHNTVISKENTAWTIAGGDYDSYSTIYRLPDGRLIRGDQIENTIGWNRLPPGTEVKLDQALETATASPGPVFLLSGDVTAWSVAGPKYKDASTYYVFPNGHYLSGDRIEDWDDLPDGTQMIVDFEAPQEISLQNTPYSLVGRDYKSARVVYLIPGKLLQSGDTISNFTELPQGTLLFRAI
ncbi:N-acetylmuramoyl-L-alanine amidase [bacterium]|nr:N-acetylmuramoyl-L-alanine amidase [bacterium]